MCTLFHPLRCRLSALNRRPLPDDAFDVDYRTLDDEERPSRHVYGAGHRYSTRPMPHLPQRPSRPASDAFAPPPPLPRTGIVSYLKVIIVSCVVVVVADVFDR